MITVTDILARLGDAGEGADVGVVQSLIDGALAFVESETRRSFRAQAPVEEIIVGRGSRNLWLSEPPVLGIDYEAITVMEAAYPGADPTEIEEGTGNGFAVRLLGNERTREAVLVRLGREIWRRGYEYTVRYTRGYTDETFPADIADLVAGLVSLRLSLAGVEAVRSETIGGYSYTRFGEGDLDAIPGARATIENWRRAVLA